MNKNLNYISDEELERLINQVEQEELVAAPPDLMERILEAERETSPLIYCEAARKKEFYAYCFRVITSVAAAVALVFLLPELTDRMNLNGTPKHYDKSAIVQNVPSYDEVVLPSPSKSEIIDGNTVPSKTEITAGELVPSKAEIVDGKTAPSKEAVLQDTGFIERLINSTGWFNKEGSTQ